MRLRDRFPSAPPAVRLAAMFWILATVSPTFAQVPAEESARLMRPAEGLEATLWAAEPLVVNPTTIDIDSRGRVWVTEGINYRYSLHDDQPYDADGDRIKILEDTDGDGRADKVTVFADKIFPVPMGIAVEEHYDARGKYSGCKVYVGNSPDLLVLEDTDGDDVADRRYPLLTGFGGVDHDHGVHGMVLGPDGKLYFTQGDNTTKAKPGYQFEVTDKSGRTVATNQLATTLRVNRDGTRFEILADRQRNNYETSLDSFGNLFTSDNDDDGNRGSRVIWIMDGGTYGYRTPGSPRHWGEEVPGNVPKLVGTGNGSPSGIMVYEGDLLPEDYQGAVLEADAGTRQINHFPLSREGAAFRTVGGRVLVGSEDPWFRPIDVCAAPDGSVFVADWYDGGVGGHAFRDQTTGRIYRIAPKEANTERPEPDFGTIGGLIEALKSPNIATRDVATRRLAEIRFNAQPALMELFQSDANPTIRARALWVLSMIDPVPAHRALSDPDPRIREQAVRIHGRDVSRVGEVTTTAPLPPTRGEEFLDRLVPLADDPDAGVRRELILALRDVPTANAGEALRRLAASWDGQDRWYLEALGLALRERNSDFLATLFDGSLYGEMDLDALGSELGVALPPYVPVDRNEAFLAAGETMPPANPLTKTLGLMWMVHRAEVLPLLSEVLPHLATPALQQAGDDILMQIADPAGAAVLAKLVTTTHDPIRRNAMLRTLGRKLERDWREAASNEDVVEAIRRALGGDPTAKVQAMAAAAAGGNDTFASPLLYAAGDSKENEETRIAAIEALGRLRPPQARETLERLVAEAIETDTADGISQAAVRTLPRLGDANDRLIKLTQDESAPLGLRREALRALAGTTQGADRVLALARDGKLAESLRTDAALTLTASPDNRIRREAEQVLPRPLSASGRPLPPVAEILRRDGDPERGRAVFFRVSEGENAARATVACGACHRVQGRGRWIGPDLSTIGVKYGKEELLRSILSPSAAIGYNDRTLNVAATDGRILSGLPVRDDAERLVLKTADGQRVAIDPADIEERRWSDVSLMPEGLAETMGEDDLVDLLAFLTTLRQPVSVVGLAQALGPVAEPDGRPILDPTRPIDARSALPGPDGRPLAWRRVVADAEGRIDLAAFASPDADAEVVYLHVPLTSPSDLPAKLVLDTVEAIAVWFDGQPRPIEVGDGEVRSLELRVPKGTSDLLIRVPAGSAIVATFVADIPLEFRATDTTQAAAR